MVQYITLVLFFIVIIRNLFFWVWIWQLKEYRLDRLCIHLRDTTQGRKVIFSVDTILLLIVVLLAGIGIFNDTMYKLFPMVVLSLFMVFTAIVIRDVFSHALKRPVPTMKALSIAIVSFLLIACLLFFPFTDFFLWLVITLLMLPFLIAFVVFLFAFPTEIYTDIFIQRAKDKRKRFPHLQVIAVSGSYGKSSTKEIISHVLSQKYAVVKTTLSQNTPLAVAKTLLTKVKVSTDFFIVELGAYKRGEIRQLAEIVDPTISVTTAVSDQHLALYGTMNDVVLSEMELLERLPKDALMLMNGNSMGMRLLADKVKNGKIVWYKTKNNISRKKDTVYGTQVHAHAHGADWIYVDYKKSFRIASPLIGEHTVENILPAIYLGFLYGLIEKQITGAIRTLAPMPKTMEEIEFLPGIIAIDDTFNASPESVASAISYLRQLPKRKILVLSPLIELGKMSAVRHEEIGRLVVDIDILCVTNKNFLNEIQKGIAEKKGKTKVIVGSYRMLASYLKDILRKGDTIVFEGKEAGIVEKYLR